MKTLDEIAIECQTDKATVFTRTYAKPKGYTLHYAKLFDPLRFDPLKFMEIGAAGGESIRTWLEYMPSASIYGIDIVYGTNPYNTPGAATHPRYQFLQGDTSDPTMWKCLEANWGKDWDVIIDDGSHASKDVINSFNALWPNLKPGGLYAVEDLGCSCTPGSIFLSPNFPSHMEWLNGLAYGMHRGEGDVAEIHLSKELAILKKRG